MLAKKLTSPNGTAKNQPSNDAKTIPYNADPKLKVHPTKGVDKISKRIAFSLLANSKSISSEFMARNYPTNLLHHALRHFHKHVFQIGFALRETRNGQTVLHQQT